MLGTKLEAVDRSKLGGVEVVGGVLSSGYIEDTRDKLDYGSKDIDDSELSSSDGMCSGNEDGKFEGSSLVESP